MLERSVPKARWTRVRFDQMATQINDRIDNPAEAGVERYVGLEHLDPDSLRIRRWGEPTDVESTKLRFQPGDIIFGKRRVYQRKVAVADFEGICSAHAMVLRAKPGAVLPEFLPFFMQSDLFMERALSISVGSLSPTINWKALAAEEFLLPSIQEQARLVELLKGAEETTEAIRNMINAAKMLRQSTIDHFASLSDRNAVPLRDICEMQNGRPFPGDEYQKEGPRLLRPGNLGSNGYFKWDAGATVYLPQRFESEAAAFLIDAGDVVINLTAQSLEEGFMGRVCLARDGDRSLLNQRIGRFCGFAAGFHPEFVFRVLQSSRFQNHAVRMCEGSKIKHLFWQHLATFMVPELDILDQEAVISTMRTIDTQLEWAKSRLSYSLLDRSKLFDLPHTEGGN